MAEPIRVPAGFKEQFDLVCERLGATPHEIEDIRQKVRADFDDWGVAVQRMAAIWRFVDRVWAPSLGIGVLPSAEQCETMIRAMRWTPADPLLFERLQLLEIVELCGQIEGSIPSDIQHEQAYFGSMPEIWAYRAREAGMRAALNDACASAALSDPRPSVAEPA
jgi:hypothetical protein